ncbi:hypothetical protein F5H01DRAFT_50973 [Linnemannia elongata]|nr:hypothetical protein F5H01DRAFT_50973 [Linnemannia elongata]
MQQTTTPPPCVLATALLPVHFVCFRLVLLYFGQIDRELTSPTLPNPCLSCIIMYMNFSFSLSLFLTFSLSLLHTYFLAWFFILSLLFFSFFLLSPLNFLLPYSFSLSLRSFSFFLFTLTLTLFPFIPFHSPPPSVHPTLTSLDPFLDRVQSLFLFLYTSLSLHLLSFSLSLSLSLTECAILPVNSQLLLFSTLTLFLCTLSFLSLSSPLPFLPFSLAHS